MVEQIGGMRETQLGEVCTPGEKYEALFAATKIGTNQRQCLVAHVLRCARHAGRKQLERVFRREIRRGEPAGKIRHTVQRHRKFRPDGADTADVFDERRMHMGLNAIDMDVQLILTARDR